MFRREIHTHIHLDYAIVEILSCKKKKKLSKRNMNRTIFKASHQEVILTKENGKESFIDLTHKFKASHQEVILT